MFIIVIAFALASAGAGEAVSHDQFASLEVCEAAGGPMTEGFRRAIEAQHGPVRLGSRCVPAGTPA